MPHTRPCQKATPSCPSTLPSPTRHTRPHTWCTKRRHPLLTTAHWQTCACCSQRMSWVRQQRRNCTERSRLFVPLTMGALRTDSPWQRVDFCINQYGSKAYLWYKLASGAVVSWPNNTPRSVYHRVLTGKPVPTRTTNHLQLNKPRRNTQLLPLASLTRVSWSPTIPSTAKTRWATGMSPR